MLGPLGVHQIRVRSQAHERPSVVLQDGRSARAQRDVGAADRARVAASEIRLARTDAIVAEIAGLSVAPTRYYH